VRGEFVDMEDLHGGQFLVGGKNIVGMWLTVGIAIAYYLFSYFRGYPRKQFWLAFAGLGMILGVVATLSIGASIGLLTVALGIVWLRPRLMSRLRLLILALFILILVFSGPLSDRLQSQQLTTFDSNWGTNRGELWMAGIHTIGDHPLFGIGTAPARRIAMLNYVESWFIQNWYELGILVVPHNIFLSVGVDIGLPGLFMYLLLLNSLYLSLLKIRSLPIYALDPLIRNLTNILLISLLAFWVQGMGLSVHLDKLMWFFMGAAVALARIAAREEMISRGSSV
jgi:putative inorganic carbon (HCO3(-)) transporter